MLNNDVVLDEEKTIPCVQLGSRHTEMKAPLPIIVIDNERDCSILVNLNHLDSTIVIFRNIDNNTSLILKSSIGDKNNWKFRSLLFENCINCEIIIIPKLIGCQFIKCAKCDVIVEGSMIEKVNLISCKSIKLSIHNKVEIIQIGRTKTSDIHQSDNNSTMYIVDYLSTDISCNDETLVGRYGTLLTKTEQKIFLVKSSDYTKSMSVDSYANPIEMLIGIDLK
uniref:Adenylate cyclase-associated CAP C-terminal domain-containing protein n=1 Tax=Pithovirus LCPAC404 TaxID=2506597 RepID=A0A481ZC39_9VIRU|nr:MAG: hypothetical protein LCPAC404_02070 [Pithovirus LCPAC404]